MGRAVPTGYGGMAVAKTVGSGGGVLVGGSLFVSTAVGAACAGAVEVAVGVTATCTGVGVGVAVLAFFSLAKLKTRAASNKRRMSLLFMVTSELSTLAAGWPSACG